MISGALGQFIASPTDLVKVQMQMEGMRRLEGKPPRWDTVMFYKTSHYVATCFEDMAFLTEYVGSTMLLRRLLQKEE